MTSDADYLCWKGEVMGRRGQERFDAVVPKVTDIRGRQEKKFRKAELT